MGRFSITAGSMVLVLLAMAGCSGGSGGGSDPGPADVPAVDAGQDPGVDPGIVDVPAVDVEPDPGVEDVPLAETIPETIAETIEEDVPAVDPGAGDAPWDSVLPETPAGKQLQWFVDIVNATAAGTYTLAQADYDAHFSEAYRTEHSLNWFKAAVIGAYTKTHAPLVLEGFEDTATDTALWARVHATGSAALWIRMYIRVEEATGLVEILASGVAADLDPAFGAVQADQIGVYTLNPNTGKSTEGATVEAVDRTTGLPFDPPSVATVDAKYEYAAVKVPAGQAEVGLKVTQTDGQVTYTFSKNLVPGAGQLWIAAFPNTAFPNYAKPLDLTLEAGKAQVWGMLGYEPGGPRWKVDLSTPTMIGCATVTAEPAPDKLYYTAPPYYQPTAAATQTSAANSTFFAFNMAPGTTTFTAQAEGAPVAVAVPLAADAITFVFLDFDGATYPANPTPAGCSAP